MDRRSFARLSGFVVAGAALPARITAAAPWPATSGMPGRRGQAEPAVDAERLAERMRHLATFGRNAAGGIDRVAFSDADLAARAWVRDSMEGAGLTTSVDAAGNVRGMRAGTDPELAPLALGSHIDSVPGGGNFDGQVGSMGALEVAWALHDADTRTRHPLEFLIFSNEEGGKTGSRALAGEVAASEMALPTASGYTIGEGLRRLGGDPDRLVDVRRSPGDTTAFLELHVEQGGVLDADGVDIGVVEGIVGIMRWNVDVVGETNHAGTTPMDRRNDALVAAARFVDAVHRIARSTPGRQVATVGRIEVEPGAPNVIPGRARASLEIRDLTMAGIERLFEAVRTEALDIGRRTGVEFAFERFYVSGAAPTHPGIRDVVERQARALGLRSRRMPSGAGHDAQSMAVFAPVGMIFVPSRAGVSHAPEEFTDPGDVANGARVLLRSVLELDRTALPAPE